MIDGTGRVPRARPVPIFLHGAAVSYFQVRDDGPLPCLQFGKRWHHAPHANLATFKFVLFCRIRAVKWGDKSCPVRRRNKEAKASVRRRNLRRLARKFPLFAQLYAEEASGLLRRRVTRWKQVAIQAKARIDPALVPVEGRPTPPPLKLPFPPSIRSGLTMPRRFYAILCIQDGVMRIAGKEVART